MSIPSRFSRAGRSLRGVAWALGVTSSWLVGCSSDGEASGPTDTGQSCVAATSCYPDVATGELLGEAVCLDRVEGGYCTHECTRDSDCCSARGECNGRHPETCAPFESTGEKYCFLSCEDEDFSSTNLSDADVYCQTYAGAAFHCRSTGGGEENRKVCVP